MGGSKMSIYLTDEQIEELIQSAREVVKRLERVSTEELQNALMKINFEELKNTNFDPNEFGEVIQKLKQK
jgi:predicted DNA-binding protein (UPF0278 family)